MEKNIICKNCDTENVIIESKLFFSEKVDEINIPCPSCHKTIQTEYTDGWFFIQTKEQFIFEQKIEEQKESIKYSIV